MRRTLEIVALLLLLMAWAVTFWAVSGPNRLAAPVPDHFNAAGQPDAWASRGTLWLSPIVASVIYTLMTLVARYPAAFNFPLRAAPAARRRLEAIALGMLAWLKCEVICLFAWIQYETIHLARGGQGTLPALFLPAVLVTIFGTIAWHVVAMRRAARAR
jgi:Protein of unknown function (DUF1648)